MIKYLIQILFLYNSVLIGQTINESQSNIESITSEFQESIQLPSRLPKILALGDPTHFEGTINTHRIKLIDDLITKNKYEWILFESNVYEMNKAYQKFIETQDIEYVFEGMFPVFKCKELMALNDVFQKAFNNGINLKIGGFDTKFSGLRTFEYLKEDIEERKMLPKYLNKEDLTQFYSLLKKLIRLSKFDTKMNIDELLYVKTIVRKMADEFSPNTIDDKILKQGLINILSECERLKHFKHSNRRDSLMSENVEFFSRISKCNMILWGSSSHFVKESHNIKSKHYKKYNTLGNYLHHKFHSDYFFLAYSSLGGHKTNLLFNSKIKSPHRRSIEFEALNYVINNNRNSCYWKAVNNTSCEKSRFLGHFQYKMNIASVCDGILFINHTQPFHEINNSEL